MEGSTPSIAKTTNPEEWVVVMLSARAEGENPTVIEASIHHLLRNSVVYIPASVVSLDDEVSINYLIDGYAFIRRDTFTDERFYRLEGSKYIQSIITKPSAVRGTRVIACISGAEINRMREMVRLQEDQGIEVGDRVMVTSGPYKRIEATVIEEIPEMGSVQVLIHLRSKESLVTLPRSCLRLEAKAPYSPWFERGRVLCAWFRSAMPVLLWSGDAGEIRRLLDQYLTLHGWLRRMGTVAQQVRILKAPSLEPVGLDEKACEYIQLSQWVEQIRLFRLALNAQAPIGPDPLLQSLVESWQRIQKWTDRSIHLQAVIPLVYTDPLPLHTLVEPTEKWDYLQRTTNRAAQLSSGIRKLKSRSVLVDGNNMVCRCAMAPGLSELCDKKGRPTGGIVGTLNALAALKKRYPDAQIYFVWDGSSQRRRLQFPEYKAGRGEPKATFEGSWLRDALPYFGITQVTHPEEEADDLIASMVKGALVEGSNIIVSTDRDLLQLVTETTQVLVPTVGAGKEKLYTPSAVREEYGIDPELLPQLRALSGDTSDNIPGVPGFGLKTARKVLSPYKTVDKLLRSNMAELSQTQYRNLKSHASQIRMNAALMTLVQDLPCLLTPASPDLKAATQRLQDVDAKVERAVRILIPDP
ncbi:MAG: 5'-3' exonuclease H3TH domain-containing protein [Parcubacteria group bacterium]